MRLSRSGRPIDATVRGWADDRARRAVLLVSAVLAGDLLGPGKGWVLTGVSVLPLILAALAAFRIGSPQREMAP